MKTSNLRIFLFYIAIAIWTISIGLIMLPFALLSRNTAIKTCYIWSKISLIIIKIILKITYDINGTENIPNQNCIIASNHQSAFETIFFLAYFKDPIFILKKELFYLPIIGIYCLKAGMIFIDRKKPIASIKELKTKLSDKNPRKIIIFPEGTRIKYNTKVKFKTGIYLIANSLKLNIIPTAHNAGKYWPKGFQNKKQGQVITRFLSKLSYQNDKNNLIKTLENNIYSSIK
ncbi:lysophospholipid acyltransferase family protein [Rickettsiales bacterium]|nr:lysophospholipid acyltransferase family protein [Rickettsiales bacterium]